MLTPEGVAELEKVLVRRQGARPGRRLHHPQAARGDVDRRSRHDPQAGPRRRHARRGRPALAHARRAPGRDRPDHVRRGGRAGRGWSSCEEERPGARSAAPRWRRRPARARRRDAPAATAMSSGIEDVSLGAPRGRDPRRRGRGRQRPARARRGRSPGSARATAGEVRLFGAPIAQARRARAPEARAALRHRRPPRRGDRGLARRRPQSRAQADRPAAVLEARADPARGDRRAGARAGARSSTCARRA